MTVGVGGGGGGVYPSAPGRGSPTGLAAAASACPLSEPTTRCVRASRTATRSSRNDVPLGSELVVSSSYERCALPSVATNGVGLVITAAVNGVNCAPGAGGVTPVP